MNKIHEKNIKSIQAFRDLCYQISLYMTLERVL